jgi:hypothetical protein
VEVQKKEKILYLISIIIFGKIHPEEVLNLEILNLESKKVDSTIYYINDSKVGVTKGLTKLTFELKDQKLGYQNLKALVFYEGQNSEATQSRTSVKHNPNY